jgi:UDP-N-acetylglucosamine 4,6-dehydratase|tara:strand:- start:37 stop:975 length:939 start_codon:yes stop_codon:yes gene_type:complete
MKPGNSKKRVLIIGGSGTIGKSFIRLYYDENISFYNFSRNENSQTELHKEFPKIPYQILGNVEDRVSVYNAFEKVKPDIVIHAAAVKHIDLAERQPIHTCRVNLVGSLNIIDAAIRSNTSTVIAISTDKACSSASVYGDTKALMEKCFLDANTDNNRFSVCRFANVAHSNGSVLPFWLQLKSKGKPLKLTDPNMNRLMFTQNDAAKLINRTIKYTEANGGGFIASYKMKCVNMLDLAKVISDEVEIMGKRPGEKTNEDLIAEHELPYTYVRGNDIHIRSEVNEGTNRLEVPYNSKSAEKMSSYEMDEMIRWT